MRIQDQKVFREAARKFEVWIVVRQSNPRSEPYIGRGDCLPKPIECKAKTADVEVARGKYTAGLVVSPEVHPRAFGPGKLQDALKVWKEFALRRLHPRGKYAVEMRRESPYYGCVMLGGKYLYSDYDLYDIIDPRNPFDRTGFKGRIRGRLNFHGPFFKPVMQFINARIRSGRNRAWMIQHGEQVQLGHEEKGEYDIFGPGGEVEKASSNPSLQVWFQFTFGGIYR